MRPYPLCPCLIASALFALACQPQGGLASDASSAATPPRPTAAAPLADAGIAPRTDAGLAPPADAAAATTLPADLRAMLTNMIESAVLDPQPSLPEPRAKAAAGEDAAPSPSLVGRDENGEEVLEFPLRGTKVLAEVAGNVARVEVQQLYFNPSQTRLEAVYAFPLPANAAVTDMYFRIGRRVVYSEVKRRDEARQTYEAARREGKTAALTEQERPNLFTQSVANIPPGETVAVVLRYVHEMPFDDGRYLFVFPTTIGPRYIPGNPIGKQGPGYSPDTDQVEDASRITPPVIGPGYRSANDLDILVRLLPGRAFDDVRAKSHRIVTGLDGGGARLVALAEDDRRPNKDFVLAYRPAGAMPQAHALVQREKGEDYLMLFVQPPAVVPDSIVRPKEVVFLLDKSGSMSGAPIETAKRLVVESLQKLGPDDTFQIVAFDGSATAMSSSPLPNEPENVRWAQRWLGNLYGGGGTEMLQGILAALSPPEDPRRLRMVVFCTDGFIGNEAQILDAIDKTRGAARVFAFGIGSSVNRYLIDGMARVGRGASDIVGYREDPEEAVGRLFSRLDRPVLTDLSLSFDGVTVKELLPKRLPDLFAGQPLVVVARYYGGGSGAITLDGKLGLAPFQQRIPLEVQQKGAERPVIGTLWARRKIDDLSFRNPYGPRGQDVEEITRLGLQFKLVTAYTSFVAVERELLADPNLPLTQILVPNELPEGVSADGIFGEGAATAQVLPARVKPGDPEVRVRAPASVKSVLVTLPFGNEPREALFDPTSGDFVLRFLVPPGWPDGSFAARIALRHDDGREEVQTAPIRVDTTPASVAVIGAPDSVRPGEALRLEIKPALALARLAQLATKDSPGGLGDALKGAMEVKEVLVRAPWGEIATAKMEGLLGAYVAELKVPEGWKDGAAKLEIAASDAAGNVTRRFYEVRVGEPERGFLGTAALALFGLSMATALLAWRKARAAARIEGSR
ncbi:MAG: VIT and vWA domain-containing protein [Myxococcales bacterium]|jgi:Ca-activated chloride channel family protein